jgi:hypothetical protein
MRATFNVLIAALLALLGSVLASAQTPSALTNDDILKMVRAGLSSGVVLTTIQAAPAVSFDVSPNALIELKANGVDDGVIEAMQSKAADPPVPAAAPGPAPERSEQLATSRDPDFILRNFKTMLIDTAEAVLFKPDQVKAGLWGHKDFESLGITVVEDPSVADVVLVVGYTFAWDYPFSLRHQNTSVSLLSGKGTGPFSAPAGAKSVAREFIKLVRPYRTGRPPTEPSGR